MSLFAEIARFRKPEADECTVESNDKTSAGAVKSVRESVVKGSEDGVSGEKENSSALDNVGKYLWLYFYFLCLCVLVSVCEVYCKLSGCFGRNLQDDFYFTSPCLFSSTLFSSSLFFLFLL